MNSTGTGMDYLAAIIAAHRPADVFGSLTGTEDEQLRALKATFRKLVKVTHTDRNADPRARDAFVRLRELYEVAKAAIKAGSYTAATAVGSVVLRTRLGTYRINPTSAYGGHASDYHEATLERVDGTAREVLVKMVRSPGDTAGINAEASALKRLFSSGEALVDAAFFPDLVESFTLKAGSVRRGGLVFGRPPGRWFSMEAVMAAYPDGLNAKDTAWMFRRLLYALGVAHAQGLVHGAVMAAHVLVEPSVHGLMLVDWKHAVPVGQRIKSIPKGTRALYPAEVTARRPATAATDIYMAARVMAAACGADLPGSGRGRLLMFFSGCCQAAEGMRPQEAGALLREFDELIVRMWGPRRYHAFAMR